MSTADGVRVATMTAEHADEVLAIYQHGIDEGDSSFETTAPSWAEFDRAKLPHHRYVALGASDEVLGWVAAVPVSDRCAYAGVVEHSVYVRPDARGRGIGSALLSALITSTETAGIWTIQSGVFPENTGSLALHRTAGFRVVGTRERIGRHHGAWRDVVLIERRSPLVS
ncbi:GNAT family N-acetyltransferase [Streptomyces sp. NPDC056738]|uniref:GNAT family N-acetyltransferase n=1 Tax=Streptomyces sp. NPDC056738 TaxID=3345933 RepID=UPI0036A0A521